MRLLLIVMLLLLSGCSVVAKDMISCENENVKANVIEIVKNSDIVPFRYFKNVSSMHLEDCIATDYQPNINKYSCTAKLILESSSSSKIIYEPDYVSPSQYNKIVCNITYTSQLTDSGQIYINVQMDRRDWNGDRVIGY